MFVQLELKNGKRIAVSLKPEKTAVDPKAHALQYMRATVAQMRLEVWSWEAGCDCVSSFQFRCAQRRLKNLRSLDGLGAARLWLHLFAVSESCAVRHVLFVHAVRPVPLARLMHDESEQ